MDKSKQQSRRQQWRGIYLARPSSILQYPEIEQDFDLQAVTHATTRQKRSFTGQRLSQTFAFTREFSIPCKKRQTPDLTEPYIRSIIKRKVPRVRQLRNRRCVKIHHALNNQLFPCRQKLIHQNLRHPACSDFLQQNMSEFIPPENGSNPFRIRFHQILNRPLHPGISNKKICHHRAIDNNHGGNMSSLLMRNKDNLNNSTLEEKIIFSPHQSLPEFPPYSKSFAADSLIPQPWQSLASPAPSLQQHRTLPTSAPIPRSLPDSNYDGCASPAHAVVHASRPANFESSMSP